MRKKPTSFPAAAEMNASPSRGILMGRPRACGAILRALRSGDRTQGAYDVEAADGAIVRGLAAAEIQDFDRFQTRTFRQASQSVQCLRHVVLWRQEIVCLEIGPFLEELV